MTNRKFYYISNVDKIAGIRESGIAAGRDGSIPIFTIDKGKIKDVLNIAGYIASNQLFLDEYGLFEIAERGITGELVKQDISGKTATYQRNLRQGKIDPEHLNFLNIYKTYFAI